MSVQSALIGWLGNTIFLHTDAAWRWRMHLFTSQARTTGYSTCHMVSFAPRISHKHRRAFLLVLPHLVTSQATSFLPSS